MAVWSVVKTGTLSDDFRLDAEHYRPEYLLQQAAMEGTSHCELGDVAAISDGNHLTIAEQFSETGVRYLRGQDLSEFFISDIAPVYIPQTQYKRLARSHMRSGDVLVGIVGTIGSVGLVTGRHGALTGSCKLAIIRPRKLPGEYIAICLSSRVGQNELQRRIRGAVQMGLILPDLRKIPIPLLEEKQQEQVVELVRLAESARNRASEVLRDAEQAVLDVLGLGHLEMGPQLWYEVPFKSLTGAHRFGAEYFQPPKRKVIDALDKMSGVPLAEQFRSVREVYQPGTAKKNEYVRNFDLNDALEPFLDDSKGLTLGRQLGSTKKRLGSGDVVISRLRSYLREIAIVRTSSALPSVGSSEFIVLRSKSGGLSAETLFVYLRSAVVQTVLKWSQDGSNHPRFNESELLRLRVPDKLRRVEALLGVKVKELVSARAAMSLRLHEARRIVEEQVVPSPEHE